MTTQEILQGVHDWTNGKIVYDISVAHPDGQGNPTPYTDLTAALGTNGVNIPESLRKGGMSVKFVLSSDNKYVQYFLVKDEWSASEGDWEKMNLEEEVSQLDSDINGSTVNVVLNLSDIGVDANTFMNFNTGALSEMANQSVSKPFPLIQGITYNILWDNDTANTGFSMGSQVKNHIWAYKEDGTTPVAGTAVKATDSKHITYTCNNSEAKYFRIRLNSYQATHPSYLTVSYLQGITGMKQQITEIQEQVASLGTETEQLENEIGQLESDISRQKLYVAKTGNDSNTGTKTSPFLTIAKAFVSAKQNGTVIFVSSGDYKETIDVASAPAEDITLCVASPFDTVRIVGGEEYSLTKDSNYSNIYYADFVLRSSPNAERIAYLDGIASNTVSVVDSFPQMHGVKNRLSFIEFTNRLTKTYASLSDALAFMDGQNKDCLYYDRQNERVYVHSLTDLTGESLTVYNSPTCKKAPAGCNKSFHCIGIDFMYGYSSDVVNYHDGGFATDNLLLAEFVKCRFMGNYSSGLRSNALYSRVIDCESGGNGNDGFSTQLYNSSYNIPEKDDYTIIYESCWSHDNYDDGYTDHTRGRDILKNCLSSYNYKGDGYHFVSTSCIELTNCIAFHCNSHGFVFAGQSSDEGRLGLSVLLTSCLADYCHFGYELSETNYPAIVKLHDCKSMNNSQAGYRIKGTSSGERIMKLIDCRTLDDAAIKSVTDDPNATLIVINTNAVTNN